MPSWPQVPTTTYVGGTPPAIKATDLNNFQSAINDIYNGTLTLERVTVDGTGANTVTTNALINAGWSTVTDTPVAEYRDVNGNLRSLTDHNGYPMGRYTSWEENWNIPTAGVAGLTSSFGAWTLILSTASGANFFTFADSLIGTAVAFMQCGSSGGATLALQSAPLFTVQPFSVVVFETELNCSSAGATSFIFGFFHSTNSFIECVATNSGLEFVYENAGTVVTNTTTAVLPSFSSNTYDRIRMELHGSSSPYGEVARVFVNETLRGSFALTGVSTTNTQWQYRTLLNAGCSLSQGPIKARWNRQLSIPAL